MTVSVIAPAVAVEKVEKVVKNKIQEHAQTKPKPKPKPQHTDHTPLKLQHHTNDTSLPTYLSTKKNPLK